MNLFGLEIQFTHPRPQSPATLTAPAELESKSLTPAAAGWTRGEEMDGTVLTNAYEQVVWVYRAINVLAEQVANVPFRFSRKEAGSEDQLTSGPLAEFYARPHPQIDRFQYWELRVIWLMLRGECFRIPVFGNGRDGRRQLHRIIIADPAHFQHIVQDHELAGWRYTGFGRGTPLPAQVFLPEEVWFEKLPNPFNFWRGLAPLSVAATAAKTDFTSAAMLQGVLENNGDCGLIVRTEQQLDARQREQVIAALRDRKRRAGAADRPLLLWGGAEVVQPKLSGADLQFLDNRKFLRSEICAAFGVPEEIVATTDSAKYDVMAGARLNFIENRVAPLCRRLEAAEEPVVRSLDAGAVGWFDLDSLPIMQAARRSRLTAAKTGFEMGIPFNELNRALDLGFKPLPWGDTGYLPSGMLPAVSTGTTAQHSSVRNSKTLPSGAV
jgi:HK97 family phage portal protein